MAAKANHGLKAAKLFVRAVQRSGIHLHSAYLYGSYAKGTATADSDIDIALVSDDLTGWVDDLEKLKSVLLTTDSQIESVRFRPRDFRDESPLVWEIKTTGIQLVGDGKNGKRRATRKRAAPKSPPRAGHRRRSVRAP
jgi:predicted nucleotidyltransferase